MPLSPPEAQLLVLYLEGHTCSDIALVICAPSDCTLQGLHLLLREGSFVGCLLGGLILPGLAFQCVLVRALWVLFALFLLPRQFQPLLLTPSDQTGWHVTWGGHGLLSAS